MIHCAVVVALLHQIRGYIFDTEMATLPILCGEIGDKLKKCVNCEFNVKYLVLYLIQFSKIYPC